MNKISYFILASALILTACGSVPITGRKQLSLVSNQEVLATSFQQYGQFIQSAPLSSNTVQTAMVKRVGQSIANAVDTYLRNNGMASEADSYKWEFNLVKSADVNAFCMPGGKIVVYEGILPYTQDEVGLAVVMGHEVAHAVAKHSNEQMSQELLKQKGASVLSSAVGSSSATMQSIVSGAYGLGSQAVMLKYSRNHELEADQLGLIFMAMAGYDPGKAAAFWQRMSASGGGGTPEWASTHPSDNTRITQINKHLSEALKYYGGAGKISTGPSNSKSAKSLKSTNTSKDWSF